MNINEIVGRVHHLNYILQFLVKPKIPNVCMKFMLVGVS